MAVISKITLPNGSSYDIKDATARSGKQNIRNGTISGAVNWNTLTTAGTYKIQNTTMTADYNAPVGEYPYGILVVFDSDGGTEKRIMQIYFPHNPSKNYMYIRMRNSDVWTDWKGLSKDADTVDGKHASAFAAASHTHTKSQITDFPTIPTKTSQLTNDSGFKTTDNNTTYSLSKSGSTITLTGSDGSKTSVTDSDTNTWRGIQNNLTSDSTTDSLSAAQGKALKALVDGKAASNHTHTKSQITDLNKQLSSEDLNSIRTIGFYYAGGGNSVTNKPSGVDAFGLEVIQSANSWYTQVLYASDNVSKSYRRWYSGSSWTSWAEDKLTDTVYTLPTATSSTLGGVKIGSNITNSSGTISLTKANVTAALGYTPPTTNTTYDIATQSANGLMSSSDKTKLDGIATGANKTTVDSALSSTSTNPVQNKVINSALAGKAAASHTHTTQSAEATSNANASYLRQIATGTATATTSNCPAGTLYGKY